jgi:hypothetical protein
MRIRTVLPRRHEPAVPVGGLAAIGFFGGMAVGMLAWSWPLEAFSRNLFSSSPVRRFAALGYLSGRPSGDTARLLRDYIRWESNPILRRRGEQVLRQAERYLE